MLLLPSVIKAAQGYLRHREYPDLKSSSLLHRWRVKTRANCDGIWCIQTATGSPPNPQSDWVFFMWWKAIIEGWLSKQTISTPKPRVLYKLLITLRTVIIIGRAAILFGSMDTTEKKINVCVTITGWVCHTSCHPNKLGLSWKCYEDLMLSSWLARSRTNRRLISTSPIGMMPPWNTVPQLRRSILWIAKLHMGT